MFAREMCELACARAHASVCERVRAPQMTKTDRPTEVRTVLPGVLGVCGYADLASLGCVAPRWAGLALDWPSRGAPQ